MNDSKLYPPVIHVKRAFAAADFYDRHASLQRTVANELAVTISRLSLRYPADILEIGCGTGFLGEALIPYVPDAHWNMTDLAPEMVARAQKRLSGAAHIRFSVMDGQTPSLDDRFDLICSNLAFQWLPDLPLAIEQFRNLLLPHGWIAFTTLAEESFSEWREVHLDLPCGIPDYPSVQALRDIGLEVTSNVYPLEFGSGGDFIRHLKGIGATVPKDGYRPANPGQFKQIMQRFEERGARVSYHIATCLMQV